MKNIILALGMAMTGLSMTAHAQSMSTTAPAGYHLVWSDEFNGDGAPDPAKWSYDLHGNKHGWANAEKEYYSDNRRENVRVEQGHLVIEARKDDVSGMADWGGQAYSSARLVTRGKGEWSYGFYDVRAQLPCGVGQWPAIWLLGTGAWPHSGEIDIMEEVGFAPTTIYGTLHSTYSESPGVAKEGGEIQVPDLCTAFHDYQSEWTPDHITFLVDGKVYYRLDKPTGADADHWPFDGPEYMILNVAIGGNWGGQHGIDDKALPARMLVDYVRVYQK